MATPLDKLKKPASKKAKKEKAFEALPISMEILISEKEKVDEHGTYLINTCAKLLDLLKHVHYVHLHTCSYAKHEALGEFYKDLQKEVDVFCEIMLYYIADKEPNRIPCIQLDTEYPEIFKIDEHGYRDILEMLDFVYKCVHESNEKHTMNCPSIQDPLGKIGALFRHVMYKLKRLH